MDEERTGRLGDLETGRVFEEKYRNTEIYEVQIVR
jgi:hypothetical protein